MDPQQGGSGAVGRGRVFGCGVNDDVRPDLFQTASANAVNGQQVFYAHEWSALFPELDDGAGRHRTNAGQLLELIDRGAIQVEWF
jgi:hypothetical protein